MDPDPLVRGMDPRIRSALKCHGSLTLLKDFNSVADPGSGAFLTPGSGIGIFRILDLGSLILDPKPKF